MRVTQIRRRWLLVAAIALLLAGVVVAPADVAEPAAAPGPAPLRQARYSPETRVKTESIDRELGNPATADAAIAELQRWLAEDPAHAAWGVMHGLAGGLVGLKRYKEAADIVDLALAAMEDDPAGQALVLRHRAQALMELGRTEELLPQVVAILRADSAEARQRLLEYILPPLLAKGQYAAAAAIGQAMVLEPPDPGRELGDAFKVQIKALSLMHRYDEALGQAKAYFNGASLVDAADALAVLDRQIRLIHPDDFDLLDRFRAEQRAGANPPAAGAPPAKSPVVLSIKVDGEPYLAKARELAGDDSLTRMRRARLLLLADRPDEAMDCAQRALDAARLQKDADAANELIGRCIKAQDGTIGRAAAWAAQFR
jgi:tetratricopeptide (TPR) repeat protein